ncbi:hypothetical protein B0H63DRAFT_244935 [Podospora didyma]|uniref:Uncharacterized protein n=1 Tax=Podospora didyma TaxID=330526 RepID=A0AAE0KLA2_9PEZI|nr:hypothetical protein B0H63DRAFT_244935 [Podospora didyma]
MWNTARNLDQGKGLLMVAVTDLEAILRKRGSKHTTPWRLAGTVHWHVPDKPFEPCECPSTKTESCKNHLHGSRIMTQSCRCPGSRTQSTHDRVQVLLPARFPKLYGITLKSPADPMPTHGAVVFGHSWKFPLRWGARGLPTESVPNDENTPVYDSGIGSSNASGSVESGSEGRSTPNGRLSLPTECLSVLTGDLSTPSRRLSTSPGRQEQDSQFVEANSLQDLHRRRRLEQRDAEVSANLSRSYYTFYFD